MLYRSYHSEPSFFYQNRKLEIFVTPFEHVELVPIGFVHGLRVGPAKQLIFQKSDGQL
jgi:hypothetical protein